MQNEKIGDRKNEVESWKLLANEQVMVSDREPVTSAEEMKWTRGVDASVLTEVKAGLKTFQVLDLRDLPADDNGYRAMGNGKMYNVDYLLIDENYWNNGVKAGYKGLRQGPELPVGRDHLQDRFDYQNNVSREHFGLWVDGNGDLVVHNYSPTNSTELKMGAKKEDNKTEWDILTTKMEQLAKGVGFAELAMKGEDRKLIMPKENVYGVFDGAGGIGNGDKASAAAAEAVEKAMSGGATSVKEAMELANEAVRAAAEGGVTTGAVGRLVEENGAKVLEWASVGDSRIYVVNNNGGDLKVELLTKDEGFGNQIWNSLGMVVSPPRKAAIEAQLKVTGAGMGEVNQHGRYNLADGDRVVLVSDGVTGDKGDELMSDNEIGAIVGLAWNADQAAKELVDNARKRDDRTAVVIEV